MLGMRIREHKAQRYNIRQSYVGDVGYVSVLLGVVEVGPVMARHAHQRVGVDRSHL